MELKFKKQTFQKEASKAVVDVFKGQPYMSSSYLIDMGSGAKQVSHTEMSDGKVAKDFTGWLNYPIVNELSDDIILENIRKIQIRNGIEPSHDALNGKYDLTIEMETGTGKTYTYIKTMYELNKHYGWSKFIIVVPSIAIREGVCKSFEITQDHFAFIYEKKIRYFVYNSNNLERIDEFASDSNIQVMIINSQSFNGKEARIINTVQPEKFKNRRPIDVLAKTNPILIIDEPQSVEGKETKESLKDFNPLMTIRYSATHKEKYNMIYRLDAIDAYNKKLVKKIQVKGITKNATTASNGYIYLESINISKDNPTATIQFDCKTKNGIKKRSRKVEQGDNIYDLSGELEEYKEGYTVKSIDGRYDSIEFLNGVKLYSGDVVGEVDEETIRRIQIRETILSHIERERMLFNRGIKVLSLFFIDEVAKYKQYDEAGDAYNGIYADAFEEEYKDIVNSLQIKFGEDDYIKYLDEIEAESTHAGYFSIDKKGKLINSKLKGKKGEKYCDDVDAYDLIMKNKELLLDRDPKKSPVRFIFSHSALKEGWDNPNVFQICTLKQSGSEVRKRQEVGRGLRLCVNNDGERQDVSVLGEEVQDINKLTVIASESYDSFAKGLQSEMAEEINRPTKVDVDLFIDQNIEDNEGKKLKINKGLANKINYFLITNGYVDSNGLLTEKYHDDKKNNDVKMAEEVEDYKDDIIRIIDSVYDFNSLKPENERAKNIELSIDEEKLYSKEFQELWKRINRKSYYTVDFDTDELIEKSISALDAKLVVPKVFYKVETGSLEEIKSKEALQKGEAFVKEQSDNYSDKNQIFRSQIKYDLIGEIVKETGLTRNAVVRILKGIRKNTFDKFKDNPEEFIIGASKLINEEKATAIVQHISYDLLDEEYDTNIFTEPSIKGKLGVDARKTNKHLYDHLIYDSENEEKFSEELDTSKEVAVYVKLPSRFYISTPVGKYNPDWAIAFKEGSVKHIYFVAETKGSMSTMELREIEKSKIHCAEKHFKTISDDNIKYHVVDNYQNLLNLVK